MYDIEDIRNLKGIHMAHLNVRSMVNKWDNIKANFMNSGIHILRIDTSAWGVNSVALFHKVWISCFLRL